MVAIKAGKLSDRDIWPDILWTEKERSAKRTEIEQKLRAQGLAGSQLYFSIQRALESSQRYLPTPGERQKVMARLYPMPRAAPMLTLDDTEAEYLRERLSGANDETGIAILKKIAALKLFSSRSS